MARSKTLDPTLAPRLSFGPCAKVGLGAGETVGSGPERLCLHLNGLTLFSNTQKDPTGRPSLDPHPPFHSLKSRHGDRLTMLSTSLSPFPE